MVITKLIKAQPAFIVLNIQEVHKAKEAHEEHFADEELDAHYIRPRARINVDLWRCQRR